MKAHRRTLRAAILIALTASGSTAFGQEFESPLSLPEAVPAAAPIPVVPTEGKGDDEANKSPRERGRILQKRNPIASEYQTFGELGTSPGADADGEGVDYRAFFPTSNLLEGKRESLLIGYTGNYNNMSGALKSGGKASLKQTLGEAGSVAFAAQFSSNASDRRIEHYQSVWQKLSAGSDVFYLDRPRYSYDSIYTRNNVVSAQIAAAVTERATVYYRVYHQDYFDNFYRNRLELQIGAGTLDEEQPVVIEDDSVTAATYRNARTRRYFGDTDTHRTRQHHLIGGTLEGERWTIDFSVYLHRWEIESVWYDWNFNDFGLDIAYSAEDPYLPTYEVINGIDLLDQSASRLTSVRIHDSSTQDKDLAWRIDGERRWTVGGQDLWAQTGLLYREKERRSAQERQVFGFNPSAPLFLSQLEFEQSPGRIVEGNYPQQSGLDPDAGRALLDSESDKFVYNAYRSKIEAAPQSYNAQESVASAYLLGVFDLGENRLQLGGRLERTETDTSGIVLIPLSLNDPAEGIEIERIPNPDTGQVGVLKELSGSDRYHNVLPSIEIERALGTVAQARISWYQALMRPQYYDIVDYRRISIPTRSISEGNPDLDPTTLDKLRFALGAETKRFGSVSAEAYLISIDSFFYGAVSQEPILEDSQPIEYTVSRVQNGEEGKIYGFEAQWQRDLPDSLGLDTGNASLAYTYSESEATVATRPGETLTVPERSRHLLQATLSAKKGKLSGRIDLSYQSKALDDVGESAAYDVYREDVVSLSVSTAYALTKRTEVSLGLFNLTNHPERSYQGSPWRVDQNQYSSWYATLGVQQRY